jgi:hypothetical protein
VTSPDPAAPGVIDLYRFYSADGALLYVGISLHAAVRMMDHRRTQSWWLEVVQVTIEHLEVSRYEALRLERRAIHRERPRYNVAASQLASKTTRKFTCSTCGSAVRSWGFVCVPPPTDGTWHDLIAPYRIAADIAATGNHAAWRVEHGSNRCGRGRPADWAVLDIDDVWHLSTGARPQFARVHDAWHRELLLHAWETGEL